VKVEPESVVGVSVTRVPLRNGVEQIDPLVPQARPTGEEVIVPDPVGRRERVKLAGNDLMAQILYAPDCDVRKKSSHTGTLIPLPSAYPVGIKSRGLIANIKAHGFNVLI
jgi:hypothetical protein